MRQPSDSPTLNPDRLAAACRGLSDRISQRFPGRGLARHAVWFADYSTGVLAAGRINVSAPLSLRLVSWLGGVITAGMLFSPLFFVRRLDGLDQLPVFLSSLDALMTVLAATGGGVFTMRSIEHSVVRRRALLGLHTLRSFAHVTDMLQTNKSPTRLLFPGSDSGAGTTGPPLKDDAASLSEYLTFCSELYSLTAKLAAVYGEWTSDAVVLSNVDDIEDLCHGLESKTTQKLLLLEQLNQRVLRPAGAARPGAADADR